MCLCIYIYVCVFVHSYIYIYMFLHKQKNVSKVSPALPKGDLPSFQTEPQAKGASEATSSPCWGKAYVTIHYLGGGWTNPFEKYESNWKSSSNRGENKKYLKPPPRLWLVPPQPLFNVVFWSLVCRCRISVIQLLCFGGLFFLPMLNGDQGPGFPPSTVAMEYPMFNRKYIFQGSVFHCYVRLLEGILGLSGRYFAGN